MAIRYYSQDVPLPAFKKRTINEWIKTVASGHAKKIGTITYLFCTDQKIIEVNKDYLQHDYYTDIITFDYTEDDVISGDLLISLDTVRSNAEMFKVDFMDELYRVVIHGILHLCGINDQTSTEQMRMTDEENNALNILHTILSNTKR